eukprot:7192088-Pyramimonas_sp.AAC.1
MGSAGSLHAASPRSLTELDYTLGEYINYLWMEGDSHGYATDTVSGLVRFYPGIRPAVPTARQYLRNRESVLECKRALP